MSDIDHLILDHDQTKVARQTSADHVLSRESGSFTQSVRFVPGYNFLHEPSGPGQHGMEIEFALAGEHGAVVVSLGTSWSPLGVVDVELERTSELIHVGGFRGEGGLLPPHGRMLTLHFAAQPDPKERDTMAHAECVYLGGKPCWSDVSYLASDEIMRRFMTFGPPAVFERLEAWYDSSLDPAGIEVIPS